MANSENNWDKLLQVQTCGRDETNADEYHHPYEPTDYYVLERLAKSGFFHPLTLVLPLAFTRPIITIAEIFKTKGERKL